MSAHSRAGRSHSIERSLGHTVWNKREIPYSAQWGFSHTLVYTLTTLAPRKNPGTYRAEDGTHTATRHYVEGSFKVVIKERSVVLAVARASAQFFSGASASLCKFFFPSAPVLVPVNLLF